MTEALYITNAGQRIVATNYWESELARAGYLYLSWNAGAARLLIPDSMKSAVREMKSAKYVIISRGPWAEMDGQDGLELLFEDGTDEPYCIHMAALQTDRLLPAEDVGGGFFVTVVTRGGEKLRLPGRYRDVAAIPCMEPWSKGASAKGIAYTKKPIAAAANSSSSVFGCSWDAPVLGAESISATRCDGQSPSVTADGEPALCGNSGHNYAYEIYMRYSCPGIEERLMLGMEPWEQCEDDVFDVELTAALESLKGYFSAAEVSKLSWTLAEFLDSAEGAAQLILDLPNKLARRLEDVNAGRARWLVYPFEGVDDEILVSSVSQLSDIQRVALVHALVRIEMNEDPHLSCIEEFCGVVGLVLRADAS